jgi:hypothetical protein
MICCLRGAAPWKTGGSLSRHNMIEFVARRSPLPRFALSGAIDHNGEVVGRLTAFGAKLAFAAEMPLSKIGHRDAVRLCSLY